MCRRDSKHIIASKEMFVKRKPQNMVIFFEKNTRCGKLHKESRKNLTNLFLQFSEQKSVRIVFHTKKTEFSVPVFFIY